MRHRNVLKRHERIRHLQQKALWTAERSPLGLPKIKSIQFKVKKTPKAAESAAAAAAAPGAGAAPSTTPPSKSSKPADQKQ